MISRGELKLSPRNNIPVLERNNPKGIHAENYVPAAKTVNEIKHVRVTYTANRTARTIEILKKDVTNHSEQSWQKNSHKRRQGVLAENQ